MAAKKTTKPKTQKEPMALPEIEEYGKDWNVNARLQIEQQMSQLHSMIQGAQQLKGAPIAELNGVLVRLTEAWNTVNSLTAPLPPANPYYF